MTKEEINQLKEDKDIKFVYKIPCSLYDNGYRYIIIGNISSSNIGNIWKFSLDDWFLRMYCGSLLPYVCSTLPKSCKIKEYLNIYEKPDLLKLRKFILSLKNSEEIIQESLWGLQIIKEFKVNRPDVFKIKWTESKAIKSFLEAVEPMFKKSLYDR